MEYRAPPKCDHCGGVGHTTKISAAFYIPFPKLLRKGRKFAKNYEIEFRNRFIQFPGSPIFLHIAPHLIAETVRYRSVLFMFQPRNFLSEVVLEVGRGVKKRKQENEKPNKGWKLGEWHAKQVWPWGSCRYTFAKQSISGKKGNSCRQVWIQLLLLLLSSLSQRMTPVPSFVVCVVFTCDQSGIRSEFWSKKA